MTRPTHLARLERQRLIFTNQMLYADMRGNNALANGNLAHESGKKNMAERYYDRGQYWLDRSNMLREKISEIDSEISGIKNSTE